MFRAVMTTTALAVAIIFSPSEASAQQAHEAHAAGHGHHHADFASERLLVRVDGEGPRDIILIPGLSSSPDVWDSTVAHLGSGWRVHRIHVQGFAGAPAEANADGDVAAPVSEEIARYVREAGLNKPIVVGHSMGGTMAMMLAARHPEAVGRVMIVDMIPFIGAMLGDPNATEETVTPLANQIAAAMAAMPREAHQAAVVANITRSIDTASLRPGPIADALATDQQIAANVMRELFVTDLRQEIAGIAVPVSVVYTTLKEPALSPTATDFLYQRQFAPLPGVKLKRIDNSAHFIMLDQPKAFFAELDAFVAE